MNDPTTQLPPDINFSSFDFTNLINSFLPDEILPKSIGEKYLVFFLGAELYAISTKQISEVAPPMPITPLPNAPKWLIGVANLRNEIISIVSLPVLLEKQSRDISPKSKLVILRSPDSTPYIAFTADRLSEIISLQKEEIQLSPDENSPHILGKAVHLSNHLNLIDTEKILLSLIIQ